MAEYEVVDDNWNVRDHIEYMGCSKESGDKYYVLLDRFGEPLLTTTDLEEAIREAGKRDVRNHHWITALPKKGVAFGTTTINR